MNFQKILKITRPAIYFVLGGPGSGKGTQSQLLCQKLKFKHLSAGELLRNAMAKGSQYKMIIEQCINEGCIVRLLNQVFRYLYVTVKLLEEQIFKKEEEEDNTYLIDGFPRNYENMQKWVEQMDRITQFQKVIHIKCSEEEMIKRIVERSKYSGRSDDNIEILVKRFKTYENDTKQIIEYYEKQQKVIDVNGDQSKEEVFSELLGKM